MTDQTDTEQKRREPVRALNARPYIGQWRHAARHYWSASPTNNSSTTHNARLRKSPGSGAGIGGRVPEQPRSRSPRPRWHSTAPVTGSISVQSRSRVAADARPPTFMIERRMVVNIFKALHELLL